MFESTFQFPLGDDIAALREAVRDFAQNEIAPRAADIDRDNLFPHALWKKLGDLGVNGLTVPEAYGGTNLGTSRTWWRWRRSAAPAPRSA